MAIRGTKKTIPALEELFETGQKPVQQDFFDWMASFYHKDEDISFLINIAKATLTDAQTGSDNGRFMTALRVYQAILWHVRTAKLPLLELDIAEMISDAINTMWNQLLATNDGDNIINTLGEVFQAFQNFNEEIGLVKTLSDRIGTLEGMLAEVPNVHRQVQNSFDSLSNSVSELYGLVATAQTTADTATTKADNAQGTADDAWGRANNAQSTADTATTKADNAQYRADDAWDRANNAQGSADAAQSTANTATTKADNAQYKADDAWGRANDAQSTANSANSLAQTAQNFGYQLDANIDTVEGWVIALQVWQQFTANPNFNAIYNRLDAANI